MVVVTEPRYCGSALFGSLPRTNGSHAAEPAHVGSGVPLIIVPATTPRSIVLVPSVLFWMENVSAGDEDLLVLAHPVPHSA